MNKNPFAVAPPYTPHQPPLPPGPPPPQPTQADYSAYWAAAAAAQQPAVGPYNSQWPVAQPAPAPPRPSPEQSALYANYGYGGQQNLAWQQSRQPQHFQAPLPPVSQPPPPPQPAYNPYQPQAGAYPQPYVPQVPPQPSVPPQASFQPAIAQQPPQFAQQPPQGFFAQQQNRGLNHARGNHNLHHSPQHLPPAKRQRFDGPSRGPPPQPQFHPPAPSSQQSQGSGIGGGVMFGHSQATTHSHGNRGGGPAINQPSLSISRGSSFSGARGNMNSRARGGSPGMNRGGRGRGSGYSNAGSRSGASQGSGSFRGHNSNRGFGSRDNRRGGSFNAGSGQSFSHGHQQQSQQHHQQGLSSSTSFRGRSQNTGHSARGRHDAAVPHGPREAGSSTSVSGKKDENRRTLTDFKILALEIRELGWNWGTLPLPNKAEVKEESALYESSLGSVPLSEAKVTSESQTGPSGGLSDAAHAHPEPTSAPEAVAKTEAVATVMPPPPSRIRIYFHTPVTADDAHPITSQPSFALGSSDSGVRKGKRKKLDDDGDIEDGRGPPPLPPGVDHDAATSPDHEGSDTLVGRDSVAPSIASEGDWLMAAIGTDSVEGEGDEEDTLHVDEHLRGDGNDAIGDDDGLRIADLASISVGIDYDLHDDGGHAGDDTIHFSALVEEPTQTASTGTLSLSDRSQVASPQKLDTPPLHCLDDLSGAAQLAQVYDPADGLDEDVAEPTADAGIFSAQSSLHGAGSSEVTPPQVASLDIPITTEDFSQSGEVKLENDMISDQDAPLQVSHHLQTIVSSLKREDSTATIPDADDHEGGRSPYASTVLNEEDQLPAGDPLSEGVTQPVSTQSDIELTHSILPAGAGPQSVGSDSAKELAPSANRLSISYAAGTRRMVIDAEIVEKLRVYREEARIEVSMTISKNGERLKGIMVEEFSDASTSYKTVDITSLEDDRTVPPFFQIAAPYHMVLVAYLDKERPLSEPRWVRTGDVQEWLRSMFGRMFWVAGEAAEGWEKKIEVVDPDPPPTIFTVLEAWATNSNVGTQIERQRFLRTHMTETDNILEILLRLVRGERATYSQSTPAISAPSVSGPLLSALSPGSAHGAQQTHVSLAVLAIFRLSVEFAKKALGDGGKRYVEERVGEIIRSLPSHLIYKSLDGIFKEWRMEKKGGR